MVPGAGRDTNERDTALDGDRGHQGLRAVPPGHAQAVRPPADGVPGQLLEVEPTVEHHRLDSERGGQVDQPEAAHLAAPRPRVAEEHRVRRCRTDRWRHRPKALDQGRSGRGDADGYERSYHGRAEHGLADAVAGQQKGGHEARPTHHDGQDPHRPPRLALGYGPPGAGHGQHDAGHGHDYVPGVVYEEDNDGDHEEGYGQEGDGDQGALAGRGRRRHGARRRPGAGGVVERHAMIRVLCSVGSLSTVSAL